MAQLSDKAQKTMTTEKSLPIEKLNVKTLESIMHHFKYNEYITPDITKLNPYLLSEELISYIQKGELIPKNLVETLLDAGQQINKETMSYIEGTRKPDKDYNKEAWDIWFGNAKPKGMSYEEWQPAIAKQYSCKDYFHVLPCIARDLICLSCNRHTVFAFHTKQLEVFEKNNKDTTELKETIRKTYKSIKNK